MKILAIDIGTGTQDILLFDSRLDMENAYKLVLPSPAMRVRQQILYATKQGADICLEGVIMGGGPSTWAVEEHLRHGNKVYATLDAALTFDDDPQKIKQMGISLLSEEELIALPSSVIRVQTRDLDYQSIHHALNLFGVLLTDLSLLTVCVFDHGCAPIDVSDRKFRFDFLDNSLRIHPRLSAFAYPATEIPASMTRMKAVAECAKNLPFPLMVMDSAPAAVMGAMLDPIFEKHQRNMMVNIGNGHTLAFRLNANQVEGVFEHHTGRLNTTHLDDYLIQFASGSLQNEQIFQDQGHGSLLYTKDSLPLDQNDFNFIVTGPRQNMASQSSLKPHFAAPFGDMMMTGCFGLLSAAAEHYPAWKDEIQSSLHPQYGKKSTPWDIYE